MTKSDLIAALANQQMHLMYKDVQLTVDLILHHMARSLRRGERVEIRGFGSFTVHEWPARMGRNPKTGEAVAIPAKRVPRFRSGKALRNQVQVTGRG